MDIGYNSDRTKRVYGSLGTDLGGYYNGDRESLRANLTLQVGKTLLFEPQYVHNRVTLAGRPLYTSNVLNFRVSHSFSARLLLEGIRSIQRRSQVGERQLLVMVSGT